MPAGVLYLPLGQEYLEYSNLYMGKPDINHIWSCDLFRQTKSPLASAIGQHSAHGFFIGFIHKRYLAQAHLAAWSLLGQYMTQILPSAPELAGTSLLKPLGSSPPCLDFGHCFLL